METLREKVAKAEMAACVYRKSHSELRGLEPRCPNVFFENAVIGIFQSTPEGAYLNVNPALARMYGYATPAELMRSVADISHEIYVVPSIREEFKKRVQTEGRVEGLEYQIRRKDGQCIWICEHAWAVRDSRSEILYYEGTIENITRRKEAEAEKARLELQLRHSQKVQAIGTLAGGIAHDFNNILGAIIGFTEITLEELPATSESRDNLRNVLTAANRAKDLVRQILTYSRPSSAERLPVRLEGIVSEVLKLMNASLSANITCQKEIRTKDDWIVADSTQIHQVLMNMATNAGYAMRERGGTLSVALDSVVLDKPLRAHSSDLQPGKYLRLSVSDTGCGMPPEIMDRIFDPFFSTKRVGEGTGLGLSVALGIILSHGGGLTFDSRLGQGTVFEIYFPQIDQQLGAIQTRSSTPVKGRGRILIVDDEEMLVQIAQKKLRAMGYKITTRLSSPEAFRTFKKDPSAYDLVIADQNMPHLSGLELCREIRKIRPTVPVIIWSGLNQNIEKQGLESVHTFLKPVDYSALALLLQKIMPRKK